MWVRYGSKNNYYLLLYLGDKGNKAVCLDSKLVTDPDANRISIAVKNGSFDSMVEFLTWIRQEIPHTIQMAYKEFIKSKLDIVSSYDLE